MPMSPRLLRPRATGFNPRSISGLALWLDAADGSTLFQDTAATTPATATNDPVGAWLDKSGNSRHATSSTASQRPTLSAITQNSRRLLSLDGSDDRFSIAFPVTQNDPVSMFVVARRGAAAWGGGGSGGYGSILNGSGGTSTGPQLRVDAGNIEVIGGSNVSRVSGANVGVSACSIISATVTNRDTALYVEGALVDSDAGAGSISSAGTRTAIGDWNPATGGGGPLQCVLAEMLVYRSALTTAARQRVERYLASKWGITLAPQVSNADAQDWINRVYANGGTVSTSTAAAVNTFCDSIDAAGIRDRFYRLSLMAGGNLNACLVPLYRGQSRTGTQFGNTTDTNVNFVDGDYAETGSSGGLSGNGTNKYLNTGFAPNNISFGNAHACGYLNRSHSSGNFGSILHSISALNNDELGILSNQSGISTPPFFAEENTATGFVQAGVNNTTGMLLGTSTSSTDRRFYIAGSQSGTTVTNALTRTQYTNLPMFVMARNFASNPTGWNNGRICAYSAGLGMTASQVSAYYTAMQAFQTALGRNV